MRFSVSKAPGRSLRRPRLLVIDEDAATLQAVSGLAAQLGFEVESCSSGRAALRLVGGATISLAFVDASLPGAGSLTLLEEIRAAAPGCDIVALGQPHAGAAVAAIKRGARDYVTRPLDPDRLRRVLNHFCQEEGTRAHIFALEAQIAEQSEYRGMIGRSPAMQSIFGAIQRLAPHARYVLITGETGTGKELAAHAFHQAGPRHAQPLAMVNGSTLNGAVMDEEFRAAAGGTLFLDEIGELSLEAQTKLLHLIDAPPEAGHSNSGGVAVIAVTSRDLRGEVAAGRFQAGLFERLAAVEITLPPLRDRREDIPYLTAAFVSECAQHLHKSFDGLTPLAERRLLNAPWDGNIRELRNLIERACMLADSRVISERELTGVAPADAGPAANRVRSTFSIEHGPTPLQYLEREHIVDTLRQLGGNRMAAAKALGISRRALYRRLERHHISHPAPRHRARRSPVRRTS